MTTIIKERPLTKTQLDHAILRLNEAKVVRIAKATTKLSAPVLPQWELQNKLNAVKNGEFKFRTVEEIEGNYRSDWFTFPKREAEEAKHKKLMELYNKAVEDLTKPIQASYRMTVDTLVLGTASEAMASIERFAAGK